MFGEPGRGDRIARRVLIPLLILFVVLTALFYVVFDYSTVDGPSMEPALRSGDRLFVTKGYETPVRGDIVLLSGPLRGGATGRFLKRVIAIEGDTLEVVRGVAYINGSREPSSYDIILDDQDVSRDPYTVPEGHIFVMGDNRPVSWDARFFGPSPISAVEGRVLVRYAPITRIGRVD